MNRKNSKWRVSRNLRNRKRLNLYYLSQRVAKLESERENVQLQLDQINGLLTTIEQKVQQKIDHKAAEKLIFDRVSYPKQPCAQLKLWRWFKDIFSSKGNP